MWFAYYGKERYKELLMKNPISKEEFNQIVLNAPQQMQLPIYLGKINGKYVYKDLCELKSTAFWGRTGISAVCNLALFSMLHAREAEIKENYFLCVQSAIDGMSWFFKDIPFANEYIVNPCTAVYDILICYRNRKNTFKRISEMSDEELKEDYAMTYEKYKKYVANHPRLYIFEGFGGPLSKYIKYSMDETGLDLTEVMEAFENAHRYHIYIFVPNSTRGKNELAESIHTSVNIERTQDGDYIATVVQDDTVIAKDLCMDWIGDDEFPRF